MGMLCLTYSRIHRDLDAFIYDATVLEYLVAQDEECKLLTVGAWAAMTGYGAAFPRNSKHFMNFDRKVMDFSENGKNYFVIIFGQLYTAYSILV